MNIRYTGKRKIRIVGPYQWDASNGFIQEVTEQDLIDDLLTEPSNEFEAEPEPEPAKAKKAKEA